LVQKDIGNIFGVTRKRNLSNLILIIGVIFYHMLTRPLILWLITKSNNKLEGIGIN
jgi:hypothetical protein